MLLDLADVRIRGRISPISGGRVRLVLDYPHEAQYRDKVMIALSEILRPANEDKHQASGAKPEEINNGEG